MLSPVGVAQPRDDDLPKHQFEGGKGGPPKCARCFKPCASCLWNRRFSPFGIARRFCNCLAYGCINGYVNRSQFTENNDQSLAIKDYLFPEIRALEDRTDIWALKEAMKLKKVSD